MRNHIYEVFLDARMGDVEAPAGVFRVLCCSERYEEK